jgi:hypothetical protein
VREAVSFTPMTPEEYAALMFDNIGGTPDEIRGRFASLIRAAIT